MSDLTVNVELRESFASWFLRKLVSAVVGRPACSLLSNRCQACVRLRFSLSRVNSHHPGSLTWKPHGVLTVIVNPSFEKQQSQMKFKTLFVHKCFTKTLQHTFGDSGWKQTLNSNIPHFIALIVWFCWAVSICAAMCEYMLILQGLPAWLCSPRRDGILEWAGLQGLKLPYRPYP